ncbi:MAG: MFS transporter [Pyrinomonadaceae bacterium]
MSTALKQPCDEGVVRSAPGASPCPKAHGPWILAATILGSSMVFIDGTVVNVALPALQSHLNASVYDVQWVVESYALFLAALLLTGGSLGDRFGRKRIYLIGVVVFALASIWCGIAPNVNQLIIGRAVQGIGGALLVPGSLAIISASFAPADRGRAIGTWSGFTAITAAVGPVLGGWLIEHASWRAVFYINAPVALAVVALVLWRVPESRDEESKERLDWPGAALATLSLGALVFGLIESSRLGFGHPAVMGSLIGGGLGIVFFILVEHYSINPMLPVTLFRSRDFTGANLLTLFLYSALSGALFFLPLNLIQIQHYRATAAGAALLPFILIMFTLSRWSGGLVKAYGSKLPLVVGPIIAGCGFALLAWPGVGGPFWSTFLPGLVVLGIGMAVSVAPLTTTVMNSVSANRVGVASGINNAVSRTAGLLSVAVMGIIMLQTFGAELQRQLAAQPIPLQLSQTIARQQSMLADIMIPAETAPDVTAALQQSIDASFLSGFRRVMLIATALSWLSAFFAWLLIGGQPKVSGADIRG